MTTLYPDEVVTRTAVQHVPLPDGGTLALLSLDNGHDHTKPTTFGPAGLYGIADALDAVEAGLEANGTRAVAVTGKPFVFAVGADLKGVGQVVERDQALAFARLGHDVFRRLGELPVPSFAFVNGAVMGGGLEIALHCTYRTISSGVPALALPECFLGLVPGWGGTYLLPRLVGPQAALQVMVDNALNQNRMLTGPKAAGLGIADAVFEPADFLERSIAWAADVLAGRVEVPRTDHTADAATWDGTVAAARKALDARLAGAAPAPTRALDLVALARTADRDEAFAAEDEALADLVVSPQFRSGVYAFDLVQRRAKRPQGVPDKGLARPVTSVGVVGAGLMASQLALLMVRRLEVPVALTDLDQSRVDAGVARVHGEVDTLLGKGRISPDTANRLKALVTGSTDVGVFAGADLVIEAVFEEMSVKKQVLGQLEAVVRPDCVLATNTSSLSVAEMAADLEHPERMVGMHFFNPVAIMPLLEVVRAPRTDDATYATAFAVGKSLKKTCVPVADAPAFVVNRLLIRLTSEVCEALDAGTPPETVDAALRPLGLPMSPLVLLQLVGPAIALHVLESLHAAFPDRFTVSPSLQRIVEAGHPGVWSWDERGKPYLSDEVKALLPEPAATPATAEEVLRRSLEALAQEARLLLDEGVVADPRDIDLCMITGAGWPFHLGGLLPLLDREGVSERVTGQRFLPPGVASLPG
ncbi:3-hydroxyacyl-CoA dehydrogenase NAD-binding domain-containing protein [Aquipuribacter nitratireducens]|uniref:3-hydroxyacyl-CoA dehydrogenase NAD-binding domain-containing protein n=1 Tax=Aquipuribacter nitratireducens TaxID=650104 RepID=A0ABW0GRV5_9MICO